MKTLTGLQPRLEPFDFVFHAGVHKTASTHLQQRFYRNRKALARSGVRFVGARDLRSEDVALLAKLGIAHGQDQDSVLRDLIGSCHTLLVSEENHIGVNIDPDGLPAHARLYPKAVKRLTTLARRMAPHRAHLALAIRNPADLMVSAYSQALFAGNYNPWEDFAAKIDLDRMSWADMLAPIVASGRFTSITVWRYEDYHAVFDDVLDHLLGVPRPAIDPGLDERTHQGLSQAAVATVAQWAADGHKGRLGAVAREDFPVTDSNPKYAPWSDAERDYANALYADDMQRIKNDLGVTVLRPHADRDAGNT